MANLPINASGDKADVCLIEVGGTVGDIESMVFLEAVRQLMKRVGRDNAVLGHVSLVPVIGVVGYVCFLSVTRQRAEDEAHADDGEGAARNWTVSGLLGVSYGDASGGGSIGSTGLYVGDEAEDLSVLRRARGERAGRARREQHLPRAAGASPAARCGEHSEDPEAPLRRVPHGEVGGGDIEES